MKDATLKEKAERMIAAYEQMVAILGPYEHDNILADAVEIARDYLRLTRIIEMAS